MPARERSRAGKTPDGKERGSSAAPESGSPRGGRRRRRRRRKRNRPAGAALGGAGGGRGSAGAARRLGALEATAVEHEWPLAAAEAYRRVLHDRSPGGAAGGAGRARGPLPSGVAGRSARRCSSRSSSGCWRSSPRPTGRCKRLIVAADAGGALGRAARRLRSRARRWCPSAGGACSCSRRRPRSPRTSSATPTAPSAICRCWRRSSRTTGRCPARSSACSSGRGAGPTWSRCGGRGSRARPATRCARCASASPPRRSSGSPRRAEALAETRAAARRAGRRAGRARARRAAGGARERADGASASRRCVWSRRATIATAAPERALAMVRAGLAFASGLDLAALHRDAAARLAAAGAGREAAGSPGVAARALPRRRRGAGSAAAPVRGRSATTSPTPRAWRPRRPAPTDERRRVALLLEAGDVHERLLADNAGAIALYSARCSEPAAEAPDRLRALRRLDERLDKQERHAERAWTSSRASPSSRPAPVERRNALGALARLAARLGDVDRAAVGLGALPRDGRRRPRGARRPVRPADRRRALAAPRRGPAPAHGGPGRRAPAPRRSAAHRPPPGRAARRSGRRHRELERARAELRPVDGRRRCARRAAVRERPLGRPRHAAVGDGRPRSDPRRDAGGASRRHLPPSPRRARAGGRLVPPRPRDRPRPRRGARRPRAPGADVPQTRAARRGGAARGGGRDRRLGPDPVAAGAAPGRCRRAGRRRRRCCASRRVSPRPAPATVRRRCRRSCRALPLAPDDRALEGEALRLAGETGDFALAGARAAERDRQPPARLAPAGRAARAPRRRLRVAPR